MGLSNEFFHKKPFYGRIIFDIFVLQFRKLSARTKIMTTYHRVDFLLNQGVKNGAMPSHSEYFGNEE